MRAIARLGSSRGRRSALAAAARPHPHRRREVGAPSELELVSIDIDPDHPLAAFHLDFAAMAPSFLPKLAPLVRAERDRTRTRDSL